MLLVYHMTAQCPPGGVQHPYLTLLYSELPIAFQGCCAIVGNPVRPLASQLLLPPRPWIQPGSFKDHVKLGKRFWLWLCHQALGTSWKLSFRRRDSGLSPLPLPFSRTKKKWRPGKKLWYIMGTTARSGLKAEPGAPCPASSPATSLSDSA